MPLLYRPAKAVIFSFAEGLNIFIDKESAVLFTVHLLLSSPYNALIETSAIFKIYFFSLNAVRMARMLMIFEMI